jgi:hypothetical protein
VRPEDEVKGLIGSHPIPASRLRRSKPPLQGSLFGLIRQIAVHAIVDRVLLCDRPYDLSPFAHLDFDGDDDGADNPRPYPGWDLRFHLVNLGGYDGHLRQARSRRRHW